VSLARFGAQREPWHLPAVIKGRAESALRIRQIERTTGLIPFEPFDWTPLVYMAFQLGNSCLGISFGECMWLWLQLAGFQPEHFPDGYVPYWHARRRRAKKPTDSGAYASDLVWAVNNYSVPPMPQESDGAYALQALTSEPKAVRDFQALNVKVTTGPIYATGSRLVDRIIDSALKKMPVQICLPVDRSILDAPNNSVVEAPSKPMDIGHATSLVAARMRNGRRELKVFTNWRNPSFLWLPEDYVGKAYSVRDVKRVEGWV
jgi:hypothetical protein